MVFDYGVPFNLLVQQRWPGATLSIFDTNALLNDIFNNPAQYLDAPAKATGVYHSCSAVNTSDCVNSPDPISSFLWYDELHPTEKTRRSILFPIHIGPWMKTFMTGMKLKTLANNTQTHTSHKSSSTSLVEILLMGRVLARQKKRTGTSNEQGMK